MMLWALCLAPVDRDKLVFLNSELALGTRRLTAECVRIQIPSPRPNLMVMLAGKHRNTQHSKATICQNGQRCTAGDATTFAASSTSG